MKYEDFEKQVREIIFEKYKPTKYVIRQRKGHYEPDPDFDIDCYLTLTHETGGVSGGNCWESSDPREYINNEKMPEFTLLDEILEKICPDISFLKYKRLQEQVLIHDSYTQYEYYGNRTNYNRIRLDLSQLHLLLYGENV